MGFQHLIEFQAASAAGTQIRETSLREIYIFEIIEVFKNRLSRVKRLGPASTFGKFVKTGFNLFNLFRPTYRKTGEPLDCCYTSIALRTFITSARSES